MANTIERKLISAKFFVDEGVYEVVNKVTCKENGIIVATSNEHTTISQADYDKIRKNKFVDSLVSAQLDQIVKKDDEIKKLKEEKEVLKSEKLALVDEAEALNSDKILSEKLKKE